MVFPPQDLVCPDPARCPVVKPSALPNPLPLVRLSRGTPLYRVYDSTWGYDEPNPGYGDTRFAPFDSLNGDRVPALYAGETDIAALLETIFHAVDDSAPRWIEESHLREQLLVHLSAPADLTLVDLRDDVLASAKIARDQLVSSPSEHYPCTRVVARHLHAVYVETGLAHGLVWHSRQAELAAMAPVLVLVVFTSSYGVPRGGWVRIGPGTQNLLEGPGRLRVAEIATQLGATINI